MRIAATSARGGGLAVLVVGLWLSALTAGSQAQFFDPPRPPGDVPTGTLGPSQGLVAPGGSAPSAPPAVAAPKGPALQSLPPAPASPRAAQPTAIPAGQVALAVSARHGRDLPVIG